jgi:hypothetical protein
MHILGADAEQLAVVPLLAPAQLQFHGPEPVTVEAVPTLHRPLTGAVLVTIPFAAPHAPLTGSNVNDEITCVVVLT